MVAELFIYNFSGKLFSLICSISNLKAAFIMSSSQSLQYFKTWPKLLAILQMGGASGQIFTVDQIVYYLGKYIEKKQLYDEVNKRVIKCENDLLGELFNVKQFMIIDFKNLWKYLLPCLYPATRKEVSSAELLPGKEKEESNIESELPWWYFVKRNQNDDTNQSQTSGIDSYADRETVDVHDTEYEDSDPEEEDFAQEDHYLEYEPPESDSEDTDATVPVTTDEEISDSEIASLQKFQSDEDSDNDTTTTDWSVDSEIPLEEHWACAECHTKNTPTVGYCQRCWKLRKGWTHGQDLARSLTDPVLACKSEIPFCRGISLDVSDGRTIGADFLQSDRASSRSTINPIIPTFSNSLKHKLGEHSADGDSAVSPDAKKMNFEESIATEGSSVEMRPLDSQETPSVASSSADECGVTGLCNICRNNPNDAIIAHRKSSHQYCCFRCAKRLKKRGKSCPVCRQPIMLVLRNYIVRD